MRTALARTATAAAERRVRVPMGTRLSLLLGNRHRDLALCRDLAGSRFVHSKVDSPVQLLGAAPVDGSGGMLLLVPAPEVDGTLLVGGVVVGVAGALEVVSGTDDDVRVGVVLRVCVGVGVALGVGALGAVCPTEPDPPPVPPAPAVPTCAVCGRT
jgi:hypothetical protein